MEDLTGVKVGDELLVVERQKFRQEPRRVTVTKVGRKLITVELYEREEVYRIDTSRKNDGYGHSHVETPEHYEYRQRHSNLLGVLKDLGIFFDFGFRRTELSIEKLQALIAVMEDESL